MPETSSDATGQPCWADVTSPGADAAATVWADLRLHDGRATRLP
jgi:hypothetical protein